MAAALFNSAAVFLSTPLQHAACRGGETAQHCSAALLLRIKLSLSVGSVVLRVFVFYTCNARSYVLLQVLRMLQITVKHIFNVLRCCAATYTRVILQAYNVIKKLCKVCYRLFVVYGFCYFAIVRHFVTLLICYYVINILQFFQNCNRFFAAHCAMYAAQLHTICCGVTVQFVTICSGPLCACDGEGPLGVAWLAWLLFFLLFCSSKKNLNEGLTNTCPEAIL